MSEIERIQKYIKRTRACKKDYYLRYSEWAALCRQADEALGEAICLAFDYGRARGYRAAKAEGKA